MTAPLTDAEIDLLYDGPALASNRMEVRDIAPAILAMADVIRATSSFLYPDRPEPRVEIQALAPGSFHVQMIMSDPVSLWNRAVQLFNTATATATGTFLGISTPVVSAILFLSQHGKKKIRQAEPTQDGDEPAIRITFTDGTTVEVSESAWRLLSYEPVRTPLRDVVRPLERPGIDTLDVGTPRRTARVTTADVSGFDVPEAEDEPLDDSVRPVSLKLASVVFVPGNKWRLSDGDATFHATIGDLDFLNKVERGEEEFTRTDILRVRLRTVQWRTAQGLRSEHIVEEVIEHIRGPRQVPLPFEARDPSPDPGPDDLPF